MATFKVAEGTLMIMTLGFPAWVASFHRPSFFGQGIVLQGMFSHIPNIHMLYYILQVYQNSCPWLETGIFVPPLRQSSLGW